MTQHSSRIVLSLGVAALAVALAPACATQSSPPSGGSPPSSAATEAPAQPATPEGAPTGTTPLPDSIPPGPSAACNPDKEPNREYRIRDAAQCKAALYQCPAGNKAFVNECGCGCERP